MIRRFGQAVCYVLLVISVPLAVVGVWMRSEVLDTDRYVASVAPIASKPAVQNAVAARIMIFLDAAATGQLSLPADVESILARGYGPARGTIERVVREVLASTTFTNLWTEINRNAHDGLVALLTGKSGRLVDTATGAVTVDLAPVYDEVKAALTSKGIDILDDVTATPDQLAITIFQSDELASAQRYTRLFNRTVYGLVVISAVDAPLFLYLAPRRWRALLWLGGTFVLTMAVLRFGLVFGRRETAGSVTDPAARAAAEAIYDVVLASLRSTILLLALVGAGVAIVGMIGGRLWRKTDA